MAWPVNCGSLFMNQIIFPPISKSKTTSQFSLFLIQDSVILRALKYIRILISWDFTDLFGFKIHIIFNRLSWLNGHTVYFFLNRWINIVFENFLTLFKARLHGQSSPAQVSFWRDLGHSLCDYKPWWLMSRAHLAEGLSLNASRSEQMIWQVRCQHLTCRLWIKAECVNISYNRIQPQILSSICRHGLMMTRLCVYKVLAR